MHRLTPQLRIRSTLIVIALIAIIIAIGEQLRSRWLHCHEQAQLFDSLAQMHRDAATWGGGKSAFAIANQQRKAILADKTASSFRWAGVLPVLPLPSDPFGNRN